MFVSEQEEEEEGEEGGGPTTCTLGDNCQDTQQGDTNISGLTLTGSYRYSVTSVAAWYILLLQGYSDSCQENFRQNL